MNLTFGVELQNLVATYRITNGDQLIFPELEDLFSDAPLYDPKGRTYKWHAADIKLPTGRMQYNHFATVDNDTVLDRECFVIDCHKLPRSFELCVNHDDAITIPSTFGNTPMDQHLKRTFNHQLYFLFSKELFDTLDVYLRLYQQDLGVEKND